MKYNMCAISNVGKIRDNNEDNFYVEGVYRTDYSVNNFGYQIQRDAKFGVFAVFDGMGGIQLGEEASGVCAQTLDEYIRAIKVDEVDFDCSAVIKKLNKRVCDVAKKYATRLGSTIVLSVFKDDKMQVVNVGDSRAYLYRNGEFKQLSVDHNEAALYKQMNIELDISGAKNVLTQHLGIEENEFILEPSITDIFRLEDNDIVLQCSDGLCGFVSDKEIAQVLQQQHINLLDKTKLLVKKALDAGGKDNITVILFNVLSKE